MDALILVITVATLLGLGLIAKTIQPKRDAWQEQMECGCIVVAQCQAHV